LICKINKFYDYYYNPIIYIFIRSQAAPFKEGVKERLRKAQPRTKPTFQKAIDILINQAKPHTFLDWLAGHLNAKRVRGAVVEPIEYFEEALALFQKKTLLAPISGGIGRYVLNFENCCYVNSLLVLMFGQDSLRELVLGDDSSLMKQQKILNQLRNDPKITLEDSLFFLLKQYCTLPTVAECSGACWPHSFMGMGRSTIAKAMVNVLISPGQMSSPNDWMLLRLIPCLENNIFSTSADILKALTVTIRTQHQTSCGIKRKEAKTEKTYLLHVQVMNDTSVQDAINRTHQSQESYDSCRVHVQGGSELCCTIIVDRSVEFSQFVFVFLNIFDINETPRALAEGFEINRKIVDSVGNTRHLAGYVIFRPSHYVSYSVNLELSKWIEWNDLYEKVRVLETNAELPCNPCFLLYREDNLEQGFENFYCNETYSAVQELARSNRKKSNSAVQELARSNRKKSKSGKK